MVRRRKQATLYPDPPPHLSERSAQLWRQYGPTHAETGGQRALFEQALNALDRADEARRLVSEQGLTTVTKTTGAVHLNPLLKAEREMRAQFASLWTKLGLDYGEGSLDHLVGKPLG